MSLAFEQTRRIDRHMVSAASLPDEHRNDATSTRQIRFHVGRHSASFLGVNAAAKRKLLADTRTRCSHAHARRTKDANCERLSRRRRFVALQFAQAAMHNRGVRRPETTRAITRGREATPIDVESATASEYLCAEPAARRHATLRSLFPTGRSTQQANSLTRFETANDRRARQGQSNRPPRRADKTDVLTRAGTT